MAQQKLELVFKETIELKRDAKEIKTAFKEALDQTPSYRSVTEDIAALREKKKKIEEQVKQEFSKEIDKLEDIKLDISEHQMMTTDLALNKFIRGEKVEIVDEYGCVYEPVFTVKFKKTGVVTNQNRDDVILEKANKIKSRRVNKIAKDIEKLSPAGRAVVKTSIGLF